MPIFIVEIIKPVKERNSEMKERRRIRWFDLAEVRFRWTRLYGTYRGGSNRLSGWLTLGIVVLQDIRLSVPRNSLYSVQRGPGDRYMPTWLKRSRSPVRKRSFFGFCASKALGQGHRPLPRMPSRSISRTYTSSARITLPSAGIYSG